MNVETLAPTPKTTRQRRALEIYVSKLDEALDRQPRDGASPTILSIDGFSLSLDPWITAHVNPQGAAPDDGSGRNELVRQSIALWLKILVDLRKLGDGLLNGFGNLYELQAELMLDSAFGSSLFRELQNHVDGLVKRGNLEEARQYGKLQRHVRGIVRDMKKSITESNVMPLDEPLDEAIEPLADPSAEQPARPKPPVAATTERVLHGTERTEPVPRPRRRPGPHATATAMPAPSRAPSRTKTLVVLNAAALAACLVLTAPPLTPSRTIRALGLGNFPKVTPLIEVQSRPPALYAIVDAKIWSALDDKDRRRFVDGIASVLLTEGYGGLLLKTADGRIVGDWLEHGGVHVFDAKPLATARPADPTAPAQSIAAASVTGVAPRFSRFVP